jgi:hypothetical protein
MPPLQRKVDGGFFTRHFHKDNNNWQISAEGIRYLERRGIELCERLPTETFMGLWMRGLIYYGNKSPNSPVQPTETPEMVALRERFAEFHRFLHAARADSAWSMVVHGSPGTLTVDQFHEVIGVDRRRMVSRKIRDFVASPYNVPTDLRSDMNGATGAAVVAVEINLVDTGKRELNQAWLELRGKWCIAWSGFEG